MDPKDLEEFQHLLVQEWAVTPVPPQASESARDTLHRAVKERITHLMQRSPEKLMTALYILDVYESKFREAMSLPTFDARMDRLAAVILDRELEKFESRKKYRNMYSEHENGAGSSMR